MLTNTPTKPRHYGYVPAERYTVASSQCAAVWRFTGETSPDVARRHFAETNRVALDTVSIGRRMEI